MRTALDLLRTVWGYTTFRPGQWEAVSAVVAGRDLLAVLPTGAGKSICYQLPALMRGGVTVVVSPLIALMVDQVDRLARRGIRATCITSTLSKSEQERRWRDSRSGTYSLLYVAPEQLQSDAFVALASCGRIAFVAVDEAHCVSEWGKSFRPAFRSIRQHLPAAVQIVAVTATATGRVRRDIAHSLGMRDPVVIVTGFDRPNLRWTVERGANRRIALAALLRGRSDVSIAYCLTRRSAALWAEWLNATGIPTSLYHGGLDRKQRDRSQAEWDGGATRVMLATSAFGMGIDKADVRSVIHLGMPGSLSAYYQEAGRAGRDGQSATAVLLARDADVALHKSMISSTFRHRRAAGDSGYLARKARSTALRQLATMRRYVVTDRCRRHELLTHFGEAAPAQCMACDNCDIRRGRRIETTDGEIVARVLVEVIREGRLEWRAVPRLTGIQRNILSRLVEEGRIRSPADLDGKVALD